MKNHEQWLREEIRNHRAVLFSLIQWGMALLAGVESALYFIRRDIAQGIAHNQFVVPAAVFPFSRWFYGTFIQITIALLFSMLTLNLLKRYYSYRFQLQQAASQYSAIDDSKVKTKYAALPVVFFWAFPIIDIAIWIGYH